MTGGSSSAAYLRMHPPKYVVHLEEWDTRGEALRRELQIKKNRKLKRYLIGNRRDIREVIESEQDYQF